MTHMKKFYALHGRIITGKCTVVKMVHHELVNTPEAVELFRQKLQVQIVSVIQLNGKKIGLISKSDKVAELRKGVTVLESYNCDIILCASRTWGKTVDELRNLTTNKGYEPIVWIKKSIAAAYDENEFSRLNEHDAMLLIDTIYANFETKQAAAMQTLNPVADKNNFYITNLNNAPSQVAVRV